MSSPHNPNNPQDWTNPAPSSPHFPPYGDGPKKRMPWYGWVILGVAGMFTVLMIVGLLVTPTDDPAPVPVETTQPEAQDPPPDGETGNDVLNEAGGDRAMRELNAAADDPGARGDEEGYLNHMLKNDREVYMGTDNDIMLGMGRTVCDALDDGFTTDEILDMFPASLSTNTQAATISGAVVFLCEEHQGRVRQEVGEALPENAA